MAVGLFIGFLGQLTSGTVGLAIVFGVLFLLAVGYRVIRRRPVT